MNTGIKAVILDLNGIWVQSPKLSERFYAAYGVPTENFITALKEVMAKVRLPGAGDAYAYWEPYLHSWNLALSRDEFFRFWFGAEKEAPEVTALARSLKARGTKLFVLSNNFAERAAYYAEHFPFLSELADKVYYSWQTGFVKPDPRAYQLLLDENGLAPSGCVYFDDVQANLDAAARLGIRAYPFVDVADMKKKLELP